MPSSLSNSYPRYSTNKSNPSIEGIPKRLRLLFTLMSNVRPLRRLSVEHDQQC